ncbi:hypothetical protein ACFYU5_20820 [Nocardia aobensis]|uniref:Resolvase/invertase-type recombinase catalytic domain-containing protein n=1 Tax=Nocardia aobensis TaxID=257277 RepID=A0ABW6P6U9_9NOCA
MYGYLRLDVAGSQVVACEAQIRRFAERDGFDLAMIFHERIHGGSALTALIAELQRSKCHHVVVPALEHLIRPGMSRQAVEARLWREADAGVFIAAETASCTATYAAGSGLVVSSRGMTGISRLISRESR